MPSSRNVAVLIGSLRKDSLNRKMAQALIAMAPATLAMEETPIRNLPLYNADLDAEPPEAWTTFRSRIKAADALLFVTPEYNRSIPGALKNAIDVGSRPSGSSVWKGKPAGIVSVSPGMLGGFGANNALRQTFVFLDILPLQSPEAYIGNAGKLFADDGSITVPETRERLAKFLEAFARWIERVGTS